MKKIVFLDRRDNRAVAMVRTCSEFMTMALSIALKDRVFIVGRPYAKKAYVTVLFQNPWLGKINPFWTKTFQCFGDEITLDEARGLFKPQLPVPLDKRPSQNQDKFKQSRTRSPRAARSKEYRPNRANNVDPSGNFTRTGNATYTGQYAAWGAYNSVHLVSERNVVKSSVSTPSFKTLKKRDRPWNNFSYTIRTGIETFGSWGRSTPGDMQEANGYLRGGTRQGQRLVDIYPTMAYTEKSSKEALSKALSRAKAMSVNLAQAYAERKQTVSLVTTSLNRLLSITLALKKGNVAHARRLINGYTMPSKQPGYVHVFNQTGTFIVGRRYVHVKRVVKPAVTKKTFADLWLEFQYGWRPLLSDIYGSCELLANTYYLAKPLSVSATIKKDVPGPKTYPGNGEVRTLDIEDRTRVVLEFLEPTEWTNFMSKTGIANPALLAWELLPYSFVIDWAIPVGDYLGNLDALTGLNFRRMSTQTTTDVHVASRMTFFYEGNVINSFTGGEIDARIRKKSRVISYIAPLPPLPSFKPSMGVERSLSAISLLTQIFTRGKTSMK